MPGVLTHKTIMLLARDRIARLRDLLLDRVTGGGRVTDLEHRLYFLADTAYQMMSGPPVPSVDTPPFPQHPFGGVNKFAVMGSMGPDFTAFSAALAPGQAWIFDTVHKGSPDENRERVVARTIDFVFTLYERGLAALLAGHPDAAGQRQGLKALQGYVMGHLCHIAGDAISHPYINDVEWHLGTASRHKFSHAGGESSIEAEVARQVLLRRGTREGQSWEAWWPTVDEVPPQLFTGYAEALNAVYQAQTRPPAAFGEFLARFNDRNPPAVDANFVRDGYRLYQKGILAYVYGHGQWGWFGVLLGFALPLALLPVAAALPVLGTFFASGTATATAFSQVLGLATGFSAPILFIYTLWLQSFTRLGAETRMTFGLLASIVQLALAVLYFVDLGAGLFRPSLRWLLFFALPLALSVPFWIVGWAERGAHDGRERRGGASLFFALPVLYIGAFLLLYLILFLGREGLTGADRGVYLALAIAVVAAILFGVFLYSGKVVRDKYIPEDPEAFPAEQRHFVRLFDDASLFADGDGNRFYPAAGRALLKLWWEGAGDLHIRSRRYQLEFSANGTAVSQTVPGPIAPTTPAEYAALLAAAVPGLKASLAFPADLAVLLPPGAVFADNGDDDDAKKVRQGKEEKITTAEHDRLADSFVKLGTKEDAAFILNHAPKPAQAILFGPGGPVRSGDEEQAEGYRYVAEAADDLPSDSVMDFAADFAALLCLGAVPELATLRSAPTLAGKRDLANRPVSAAVGGVGQVFRNWCLDRRRVNEWRMLVAGGAVSEKAGHPERADPAMPRPPAAGWQPDPAVAVPAVEQTANTLGWVPLLRQFADLLAALRDDPVGAGGDALAAAARRPNGPTNAELSRAMAFLFDLPDPVVLAR